MYEYITLPTGKFEKSLSWIKNQQILAVDTETSGLDPKNSQVLLLQVGNSEVQFVYNLLKLKHSSVVTLLEVINNPNIVKILHNAKFDYSMLKCNYDIELTNFRCTYIEARLIDMGKIGHTFNLKDLLNKYGIVSLDKEEQSSFIDNKNGEFTDKQIQYAARDVEFLLPLYSKLHAIINNKGLQKICDLEQQCVKVTADMEINGIYIDKEKWLALKDIATISKEESANNLYRYFDNIDKKILLKNNKDQTNFDFSDSLIKINLDSPLQVKPILEKILGRSIDNTSTTYLENFDDPVIKELIRYRKLQKLITTYGTNFLKEHVKQKGRIYTTFMQLGADSGRFSSRDPNLQNIPHKQEYRDPFCTGNKKYKIISADFSNQELRLLAQLSKDEKFIEGIKANKDMHCYCASLLYNIPYEQFFDANGKRIPEMDNKYRTPAKSIVFGLVYGMGPGKLASKLKISINEAKDLMTRFFTIFTGIKKCLNELALIAKEKRIAYSSLDGRIRDLGNIDWDDMKKVSHAINIAKNHPFQGTGASTTKKALIEIDKRIKANKLKSKILITVHDEILCESLETEAEKTAQIVKEEMISAFNFFAPDIPMEVNPQIGDKWIH